ncbi:tyrosine-type recombinase/integrase [Rhodopseudomonas palustris]|uniref:tyrosine-type recombinase/integrase n=1 Tax=Rhodopseudomonas palustris TaxID=1076 RepID=UPI000AA2D53B|nr:hypothetical protein [Rhodopseudomonas palustris]
MSKKKKLGRYLEWHGNRIRVVVRVPPSLTKTIGCTKLREVLITTIPLEAEREKVEVVRRFKARLRGVQTTVVRAGWTDEALNWREAVREAEVGQGSNTLETVREALDDAVARVGREHGHSAGQQFASVALGLATPLRGNLNRWFAERAFSRGYEGDINRALSRLEVWCNESATPATVEAVTTAVAGRFIHDRYVLPKVDTVTANKDISSLHSYWKWMKKRCGVAANPWDNQRLEKPQRREDTASSEKRPFTDDEVRTLLGSIRLRREWEFSLFSALSGLRVHEIAGLRVKHCTSGKIAVAKSKTPSGVRTIPAHSMLAPLIQRRSLGKELDAYLFEELPEQAEDSERDRSAPVSQAFTRERRRLGVEEKATDKQRQSNVDFHSWRRWFVRRAVGALEKGALGYTPWTIAHVIGHKVKDGTIEGTPLPLGMTMGVYAGAASWEAMVACVNAVALPEGATVERPDLTSPRQPKLRLKQPRSSRRSTEGRTPTSPLTTAPPLE